MTLEPNQLVHVVLLGEAFYNAVSMLPDAGCEVAGDSYVEHSSRSVGEDVDAGEFQGGGRGGVREGWRPLNGDEGLGKRESLFWGIWGEIASGTLCPRNDEAVGRREIASSLRSSQ